MKTTCNYHLASIRMADIRGGRRKGRREGEGGREGKGRRNGRRE